MNLFRGGPRRCWRINWGDDLSRSQCFYFWRRFKWTSSSWL